MHLLQARYSGASGPEHKPDASYEREDAFILQFRELIESKLDVTDFGIPEMCKALGISRTNLHNKLKALTGLSTTKFVRRIRLEKAKQLLRDPNFNVSEVAYTVGFKTPGYFAEMFREEYGMSATEYRQSDN